MLRLDNQYENHPDVEEFTKECKFMLVYGTYVLEGEADAKFSLDDISNLFQGDTLPKNASNFCRQMINCMWAWNCCLILAHVLIQMKCCLFPVYLSSFHRRGRRHY